MFLPCSFHPATVTGDRWQLNGTERYCCISSWWISLLIQMPLKTQALPFSVCHLLFSSSCLSLCILKMAAAAFGIISVCSKQEEEVKRRGIRQIMVFFFFAWECKKRKKERKRDLLRKLFRRLPLHLFGQGNWVRWHPLDMRELWKWAQCDPNRTWEEGRNDVCMPPQGHHHGKSAFFQNKKNTGYRSEAKLQWD